MTYNEKEKIKMKLMENKDEIANRYAMPLIQFFTENNIKKSSIRNKYHKVLLTVIAHSYSDYQATISEISEITNITKSSVQRFLNEKDFITTIFSDEVNENIQESLIINKQQGFSIGGQHFFANNIPLKGDDAKFIGSRSRKNK